MSSETLIGLAQTVNMLRSPLSKSRDHLGRMFKSASASYGKTAESVTRANADAWLEYRYGMLPLYLDINQVIKIFSEKYTELERRRAVVRSGQEVVDNRTIAMASRALPVLTNIGYTFYAAGSVDVQRTLRISSGVMYEVSPRTLAQELAVQFSLGSTAMPSSLWEQIPFSFVGDWFFNVGDWLAANNLPPDVTVKGNWTTALQNHEDVYTSSELYMVMNGTKRYGSWGSGSKTSVIYDRRTNRPLATLPVMVQKYATVTHALDAVALLLNPVKDLIVKLR